MINHPNRSKNRDLVKVTLSNIGGPLDTRVVRGRKGQTPEDIAEDVAKVVAAFVLETNMLMPGDKIEITAIE